MSSWMHGTRVLDLRSDGRAIKSADEVVKPEGNATDGAVSATGTGTASAAALTLDDFGGRSDALGG
jgi:hypothetical protein